MTEILWHGRGGQGAFTAAKLLGAAYTLKGDDFFALSFPSFGPERRGAPVRAFTKLDRKPIGDRSEIERPNFAIYLDDTLFKQSDLDALAEGGIAVVNSSKSFSDPRVVSLDANALAVKTLGRPIANTVMLGALCALSKDIELEDLENAINLYMEERLRKRNIEAVKEAASYAEGLR